MSLNKIFFTTLVVTVIVFLAVSNSKPHRRGLTEIVDDDEVPVLQVLGSDGGSEVIESALEADEKSDAEKVAKTKVEDESEAELENVAEKDLPKDGAEEPVVEDAADEGALSSIVVDTSSAEKSSEEHHAESSVSAKVKESSGDVVSNVESEVVGDDADIETESEAESAKQSAADAQSAVDTSDVVSVVDLKDLEGDAVADETPKAAGAINEQSESKEALGLEAEI